MRNQGIIDYSCPEIDMGQSHLTEYVTRDGSEIYLGDIDVILDRKFLGFNEFTISYHGLIKALGNDLQTYEPRLFPHIAISTEQIDKDITESIMSGRYLMNREKPDSLQDVMGEGYEHSLGYASLTRYKLKNFDNKNDIKSNLDVEVVRGVGDTAIRSMLVSYIKKEISREDGLFIAKNTISEEDIDEIIYSEEFVTSYAHNENEVEAVVVLADTPSSMPWFNESRLEELANAMGGEYSDVRLAFLALTSPNLRRQRLAPVLFDLAFNELNGDKDDLLLCTECSPRSISYTPFIIARHLGARYDRLQTVTERNKATIYPKTTV